MLIFYFGFLFNTICLTFGLPCQNVSISGNYVMECWLGPVKLNQTEAVKQCSNIGGQVKYTVSATWNLTMWSDFRLPKSPKVLLTSNEFPVVLSEDTTVILNETYSDGCFSLSSRSVPILRYVQTDCNNSTSYLCQFQNSLNSCPNPNMCFQYYSTPVQKSSVQCDQGSLVSPNGWANGNNPRYLFNDNLANATNAWINLQVLDSSAPASFIIGWDLISISLKFVPQTFINTYSSSENCFYFTNLPGPVINTSVLYIDDALCYSNLLTLCSNMSVAPIGIYNQNVCNGNIYNDINLNIFPDLPDGDYFINQNFSQSGLPVYSLSKSHICLKLVKRTINRNVGLKQTDCSNLPVLSILCKSYETISNGITVKSGSNKLFYLLNISYQPFNNYTSAINACQSKQYDLLYVENEQELLWLAAYFNLNSGTGILSSMKMNSSQPINPQNQIILNDFPLSSVNTIMGFSYNSSKGSCYKMQKTNFQSTLNIVQQTSCSMLNDVVCVNSFSLSYSPNVTLERGSDSAFFKYEVFQSTNPGGMVINNPFCVNGSQLVTATFDVALLTNNSLQVEYWIGARIINESGSLEFLNNYSPFANEISQNLYYAKSDFMINNNLARVATVKYSVIAYQQNVNSSFYLLTQGNQTNFNILYRSLYFIANISVTSSNSISYLEFQDLYQLFSKNDIWINFQVTQNNIAMSNSFLYISNLNNYFIQYLGPMSINNISSSCLTLVKVPNIIMSGLPLMGYFVDASLDSFYYGACQALNPLNSMNNTIGWSLIEGTYYGLIFQQNNYSMIKGICDQANAQLLIVKSNISIILSNWKPTLLNTVSILQLWVDQSSFSYLPSNATSNGVLVLKYSSSYGNWVIKNQDCNRSDISTVCKTKNCSFDCYKNWNKTSTFLSNSEICSTGSVVDFAGMGDYLLFLDYLESQSIISVWINYQLSTTLNIKYYSSSIGFSWNSRNISVSNIPFLFNFDSNKQNNYYLHKLVKSTDALLYYQIRNIFSPTYYFCSKQIAKTITTTADPTTTSIAPTVSQAITTNVQTSISTINMQVSPTVTNSTNQNVTTMTLTTITSSNSASTSISTILSTTRTSQSTSSQITTVQSTQTQMLTKQATTGTSNFLASTTNSPIIDSLVNYTLPIENLLNIKYTSTASHHWYFNNGKIVDSGSNDNFLITALKSRYGSDFKLNSIFANLSAVNYFVPVAPTNLSSLYLSDSPLFQGDSPSLFLPGELQCLELFTISDDHLYNQMCLREIENCEYGISAAIWFKYNDDSVISKDTFLASGNDGSQGFEFYFQLGQLVLIVTGRNNMWSAKIRMTKYTGIWLIVGFSWIRSTGEIRLLIGDKFEIISGTKLIHNKNYPSATKVFLGCRKELSGNVYPKTTPKISVGHVSMWMWPVRLKEILTSQIVYQMVPVNVPTTMTTTTTAPINKYDFSKNIIELVGSSNDPNPYYIASDAYYSTSNIIISNEIINIVTNPRPGFQITSTNSKINLNKPRRFINSCPCNFTACRSGLSISFWTMIPSGTGRGDLFVIVNSIRIMYSRGSFVFLVYNGTSIVAGQRSSNVSLNTWQNYGFTVNTNFTQLDIYINGYFDIGSTPANLSRYIIQNYSTDVNVSDILIGSGANNSLVNAIINDVVIWTRYLFQFEAHRFLGYTSSQLKQLNFSKNYWTTDSYINSDAVHHLSYLSNPNLTVSYSFSLSSILRPITSQIALDGDPFFKSQSQSPILSQKNSDYLFLGQSKILRSVYLDSDINWSGKCLFDPTYDICRYNGVTISMWMKIISVSFNKIQFFLSTGDLADYIGSSDGRGISIFVNQMLFGISLSTATRDWSIIFDSNRYTIGEWMNIGILWREDIGLQLMLNGIDYGLINTIPDLRYKTSNIGVRAVVGRFDTDDINSWRIQHVWEFSNFVFGEMSYFEYYMTPDNYSNMLDLTNNLYFASATWVRQGTKLINSPVKDLVIAKSSNQNLNYQGTVEWEDFTKSVRIISARIPILLNASGCPVLLSACPYGFSIGGWFFVTEDFRSSINSIYTLFIHGNSSSNGFGVQIINKTMIFGWVQMSPKYWSKTVSVPLFTNRMSEWIHIGLMWQESLGLIIVTNGNMDSANSYMSVNSVPSNSIRLFIGDSTQTLSSKSNLLVHNMVFYNSLFGSVQLQKLLGIPYQQVQLLTGSSLFWTFYGLYHKLIRDRINLVSTTMSSNKYATYNAAVCTSGADQSYVVLNSSKSHCLIQPDLCQSFVLILNIQIYPLVLSNQNEGYILTSISQNSIGVSIIQRSTSLITFTIRSSNQTCITNVSTYQTSQWIQLQVIWSTNSKLIVKINDNTVAPAINASCIYEINAPSNLSPIILGKSNQICLSEVMLINVNSGTDPEGLTKGAFQNSCYTEMDWIFTLNVDSPDQTQTPNSASTFSNAFINTTFGDICLTDPKVCTNGLTISFWVFINSIIGTDVVLLNIGGNTKPGIQLRLQSSHDKTLDLIINLDTGIKFWTLKQSKCVKLGQWINLGVVWSDQSGLGLFINGVTTQMLSTFSATLVTDFTLSSTFEIGKQINGIINDIVVWYKVVASCSSPQKSSQTLGGLCTPVVTLPVQQKCNLIQGCVKTSGNICLDETSQNIIKLANSGLVLSSPDDVNVILELANRVLKNYSSNSNLTTAAVVLLLNAVTNMIVPTSLTNNAALTLIGSFVNLNEEIMSSKYLNDWIIMSNNNFQNPLSVIKQADIFYLKVAKNLQSTCVTVSSVRFNLGVSLLNYNAADTKCQSISLPNYGDSAWSQNSSVWVGLSDSFTITQQTIQNNQPVIAVASSIYNASQTMPPVTNLSISNPFILNSNILTINTNPTFVPSTGNNIVNINLKFSNPNVRFGNFMPWDSVEPDKPALKYQWSVAFWNDSLNIKTPSFGAWDNSGCIKMSWNSTHVGFQCEHLTSFALLMEPAISSYDYMQVVNIITYCGFGISLLALLIFIITITISKSLRGTRYIIHLNMSISLFIASLAFILVIPGQMNQKFCQTVGITMHLFFTSTFTWMFFEALYVFYAITSGVIAGRLKYYFPIAWGIPIIIVAKTAGSNVDAYGRNTFCWLTLIDNNLWSFLGPIIAFIICTILACLIVACNINTPAIKGEILDEARGNIVQTACTISLMLIGWIFVAIFMATSIIPTAYFFAIFGSLQGLWVLIFYGLMNPDFRYAICRKAKVIERPNSSIKILSNMETEYGSQGSVKVEKKISRPPPKVSGPIYYAEAPKPKSPKYDKSVEYSQSPVDSQLNLINQAYDEEDIFTTTIQNNGMPQNFSRSIPGTPEYYE